VKINIFGLEHRNYTQTFLILLLQQTSQASIQTQKYAKLIDPIQYKPIIAQEKKRRLDEILCLYCRGLGYKATNCHNKQNRRTFKMRNTITLENKDV